MRKGKRVFRKTFISLLMIMMIAVTAFAVFNGQIVRAEDEEQQDGKAIYQQMEAMGDRAPQD